MNSNDLNLYGWLFTYNPYDEYWYAATRDNYLTMFNSDRKGTYRSKDFETLKQIVSSNPVVETRNATLTVTGRDVKLGGTLVHNTTISKETYDLATKKLNQEDYEEPKQEPVIATGRLKLNHY